MVELIAAIVVFNLLVFGLTKLFIGQNQMVESLEGWAEDTPTYYLALDHDPMARALGIPADLLEKPASPPKIRDTDSDYEVEILVLDRDAAAMSGSVIFQQRERDEDDDDDDDDDDEEDDDDDEEDDD